MNTYALLTSTNKLYTLAANATEDHALDLARVTGHTPVRIERRSVWLNGWHDKMIDLGTGETIRLI